MKTSKYGKVFDIRHFPMDMGRFVCNIFRLWFRPKKLDAKGNKYKGKIKSGAVMISNHIAMLDPVALISAFLYRRIFFFASEVVMGRGLSSALMRGMGCIKIDRNIADMEAIRTGCEIVKKGHILAIFAQGQIQRSGNFETFKAGGVLLAIKAGVPIIPVYISQKQHWWERKIIVVGDSFDCKARCQKKFPSMQDIDALTADLLSEMKNLKAVCEKAQGINSEDLGK